jgi:ABC-type nickel/cobalt efflux system permease component RcnA
VSRRGVLRIALPIAVGAIATLTAGPAHAHPLGNFTVNTAARVVVGVDDVTITHVTDMAEIPTFQERRGIDGDGDGTIDAEEAAAYASGACRAVARGLEVRIDGMVRTLRIAADPRVAFPVGSQGLSTLRLTCGWRAATPEPITPSLRVAIEVMDRTHPDAIGWREITAVGDGVTLLASDVPPVSPSAGLTSYPDEELPLATRTAALLATGGGPRLQRDTSNAGPSDDRTGLLSGLLGRATLTPGAVGLMLVAAFGVGAAHALGPGHGKTLIGAYLIGEGGSLRHAVGVGAAVSGMHTAAVLVLGLVIASAERVVRAEAVYPWLGLASGLVALVLGGALLVTRLRTLATRSTHLHARDHHHGHAHAPHDHDHDHGHGHGHGQAPTSRRGLLALALSGGVLPSPTALVVLLGAVSLGRTALGVAMIAAFSLGLAASLVAVGVLSLRARSVAERRLSSRAARLLPVASAGAIVAMGVFLSIRGISQL